MNANDTTKILSQEELNEMFSEESLQRYKNLVPYADASGIVEYRESLYFVKD